LSQQNLWQASYQPLSCLPARKTQSLGTMTANIAYM
jgi:hypothetical protein